MGWAKNEALIISPVHKVDEALSLVKCLGASITGIIKLNEWFIPDKNTYLRKGRLSKVKQLVEEKDPDFTTLYVYDSLKPRQKINLMRELKIPVKDKVELILDIFAIHAGSKEAKLQIEMAQLLHSLPFIKEWINRAKLRELPGFMGPGRYAVDAYYTHVRKRIARIRKELALLRERRKDEMRRRERRGLPHVAIGGYANAGKTTLFNLLTSLNKPTGPEMFTTLSPKIGSKFINGRKIAFIDTVGFIREVPHEVIEAFHATLSQITDSDLLLLVIDSSEERGLIQEKINSSLDMLNRIGYVGKDLIAVANKVDLTQDRGISAAVLISDVLRKRYPWNWSVVRVSAKTSYGMEWLIEEIYRFLNRRERGKGGLLKEHWSE